MKIFQLIINTMKKLIILLIILYPLLVIGAKRKYHVLKKGETLWRISRRYKVSVDNLKKINKIKNTSKVNAGTRIYLSYPNKKKPKKTYSRLNIKLKMPVQGKIMNQFNEGKNLVQCRGIEYATKKNATVRSALPGTVKYTGNMQGYGNVVIIQYTKNVTTSYAYLHIIHVRVGQKIQKYQTIGITGMNNSKKQYVLHFELLKNGKPINPKYYF